MANSEIYTLTQVDDTTTYTLSYVQDGVTTEIVDIEGLSFDEEGSKEDFLNAIDIQSYDDAGTTKYKIYLTNEALAFMADGEALVVKNTDWSFDLSSIGDRFTYVQATNGVADIVACKNDGSTRAVIVAVKPPVEVASTGGGSYWTPGYALATYGNCSAVVNITNSLPEGYTLVDNPIMPPDTDLTPTKQGTKIFSITDVPTTAGTGALTFNGEVFAIPAGYWNDSSNIPLGIKVYAAATVQFDLSALPPDYSVEVKSANAQITLGSNAGTVIFDKGTINGNVITGALPTTGTTVFRFKEGDSGELNFQGFNFATGGTLKFELIGSDGVIKSITEAVESGDAAIALLGGTITISSDDDSFIENIRSKLYIYSWGTDAGGSLYYGLSNTDYEIKITGLDNNLAGEFETTAGEDGKKTIDFHGSDLTLKDGYTYFIIEHGTNVNNSSIYSMDLSSLGDNPINININRSNFELATGEGDDNITVAEGLTGITIDSGLGDDTVTMNNSEITIGNTDDATNLTIVLGSGVNTKGTWNGDEGTITFGEGDNAKTIKFSAVKDYETANARKEAIKDLNITFADTADDSGQYTSLADILDPQSQGDTPEEGDMKWKAGDTTGTFELQTYSRDSSSWTNTTLTLSGLPAKVTVNGTEQNVTAEYLTTLTEDSDFCEKVYDDGSGVFTFTITLPQNFIDKLTTEDSIELSYDAEAISAEFGNTENPDTVFPDKSTGHWNEENGGDDQTNVSYYTDGLLTEAGYKIANNNNGKSTLTKYDKAKKLLTLYDTRYDNSFAAITADEQTTDDDKTYTITLDKSNIADGTKVFVAENTTVAFKNTTNTEGEDKDKGVDIEIDSVSKGTIAGTTDNSNTPCVDTFRFRGENTDNVTLNLTAGDKIFVMDISGDPVENPNITLVEDKANQLNINGNIVTITKNGAAIADNSEFTDGDGFLKDIQICTGEDTHKALGEFLNLSGDTPAATDIVINDDTIAENDNNATFQGTNGAATFVFNKAGDGTKEVQLKLTANDRIYVTGENGVDGSDDIFNAIKLKDGKVIIYDYPVTVRFSNGESFNNITTNAGFNTDNVKDIKIYNGKSDPTGIALGDIGAEIEIDSETTDDLTSMCTKNVDTITFTGSGANVTLDLTAGDKIYIKNSGESPTIAPVENKANQLNINDNIVTITKNGSTAIENNSDFTDTNGFLKDIKIYYGANCASIKTLSELFTAVPSSDNAKLFVNEDGVLKYKQNGTVLFSISNLNLSGWANETTEGENANSIKVESDNDGGYIVKIYDSLLGNANGSSERIISITHGTDAAATAYSNTKLALMSDAKAYHAASWTLDPTTEPSKLRYVDYNGEVGLYAVEEDGKFITVNATEILAKDQVKFKITNLPSAADCAEGRTNAGFKKNEDGTIEGITFNGSGTKITIGTPALTISTDQATFITVTDTNPEHTTPVDYIFALKTGTDNYTGEPSSSLWETKPANTTGYQNASYIKNRINSGYSLSSDSKTVEYYAGDEGTIEFTICNLKNDVTKEQLKALIITEDKKILLTQAMLRYEDNIENPIKLDTEQGYHLGFAANVKDISETTPEGWYYEGNMAVLKTESKTEGYYEDTSGDLSTLKYRSTAVEAVQNLTIRGLSLDNDTKIAAMQTEFNAVSNKVYSISDDWLTDSDNNIEIGGSDTYNEAATFDFSSASKKVRVTVNRDATTNIKGTSADDTITYTEKQISTDVLLEGGAGNDTFTITNVSRANDETSGNLIVDGGEGKDIFNITNSSHVSIDASTGGDNVNISGGSDITIKADITSGNNISLRDNANVYFSELDAKTVIDIGMISPSTYALNTSPTNEELNGTAIISNDGTLTIKGNTIKINNVTTNDDGDLSSYLDLRVQYSYNVYDKIISDGGVEQDTTTTKIASTTLNVLLTPPENAEKWRIVSGYETKYLTYGTADGENQNLIKISGLKFDETKTYTDEEIQNFVEIISETSTHDGEEVTTYKIKIKDSTLLDTTQDNTVAMTFKEGGTYTATNTEFDTTGLTLAESEKWEVSGDTTKTVTYTSAKSGYSTETVTDSRTQKLIYTQEEAQYSFQITGLQGTVTAGENGAIPKFFEAINTGDKIIGAEIPISAIKGDTEPTSDIDVEIAPVKNDDTTPYRIKIKDADTMLSNDDNDSENNISTVDGNAQNWALAENKDDDEVTSKKLTLSLGERSKGFEVQNSEVSVGVTEQGTKIIYHYQNEIGVDAFELDGLSSSFVLDEGDVLPENSISITGNKVKILDKSILADQDITITTVNKLDNQNYELDTSSLAPTTTNIKVWEVGTNKDSAIYHTNSHDEGYELDTTAQNDNAKVYKYIPAGFGAIILTVTGLNIPQDVTNENIGSKISASTVEEITTITVDSTLFKSNPNDGDTLASLNVAVDTPDYTKYKFAVTYAASGGITQSTELDNYFQKQTDSVVFVTDAHTEGSVIVDTDATETSPEIKYRAASTGTTLVTITNILTDDLDNDNADDNGITKLDGTSANKIKWGNVGDGQEPKNIVIDSSLLDTTNPTNLPTVTSNDQTKSYGIMLSDEITDNDQSGNPNEYANWTVNTSNEIVYKTGQKKTQFTNSEPDENGIYSIKVTPADEGTETYKLSGITLTDAPTTTGEGEFTALDFTAESVSSKITIATSNDVTTFTIKDPALLTGAPEHKIQVVTVSGEPTDYNVILDKNATGMTAKLQAPLDDYLTVETNDQDNTKTVKLMTGAQSAGYNEVEAPQTAGVYVENLDVFEGTELLTITGGIKTANLTNSNGTDGYTGISMLQSDYITCAKKDQDGNYSIQISQNLINKENPATISREFVDGTINDVKAKYTLTLSDDDATELAPKNWKAHFEVDPADKTVAYKADGTTAGWTPNATSGDIDYSGKTAGATKFTIYGINTSKLTGDALNTDGSVKDTWIKYDSTNHEITINSELLNSADVVFTPAQDNIENYSAWKFKIAGKYPQPGSPNTLWAKNAEAKVFVLQETDGIGYTILDASANDSNVPKISYDSEGKSTKVATLTGLSETVTADQLNEAFNKDKKILLLSQSLLEESTQVTFTTDNPDYSVSLDSKAKIITGIEKWATGKDPGTIVYTEPSDTEGWDAVSATDNEGVKTTTVIKHYGAKGGHQVTISGLIDNISINSLGEVGGISIKNAYGYTSNLTGEPYTDTSSNNAKKVIWISKDKINKVGENVTVNRATNNNAEDSGIDYVLDTDAQKSEARTSNYWKVQKVQNNGITICNATYYNYSGATSEGYNLSADGKKLEYSAAKEGKSYFEIDGLKTIKISEDDSNIDGITINEEEEGKKKVTIKSTVVSTGGVIINEGNITENNDEFTFELDGAAKLIYGTFKGAAILKGSTGADTIINRSDNTSVTIIGGAGSDSITAGSQGDSIICDAGNDSIKLGAGNDTILYQGGKVSVKGFTNDDSLQLADGISVTKSSLSSSAGLVLTVKDGINNTTGSITFTGLASSVSVEAGDSIFAGNYIYSKDHKRMALSASYNTSSLQIEDGITDIDASKAKTSTLKITANNDGDTIKGSAKVDSIKGGTGNDNFDGGSGNDILIGGAGNNVLTGGAGNDTFIVGEGNDTITDYNVSGSDKISLAGGANIIDVTIDNTEGTVLTLDNQKQVTIQNITAPDTVISINGGAKYFDNHIIYNATKTGVTIGTGYEKTTYDAAGTTETTIDASAASVSAINITGNDKNNQIKAGTNGSTLAGGAGNDTLTGGAGVDKFVYDFKGYDIVTNYADNDLIELVGGEMDNFTSASLSGSDIVLKSSNSSLTLKGISGKNQINSSNGNTYTIGNNYYVENDSNVKMFNSFSGTFTAAALSDVQVIDGQAAKNASVIIGNSKANTIYGGTNSDSLNGGAGNDSLIGGYGSDTLNGGTGEDTLTGGAGSDVFIYASGDGNDVITDYKYGDAIKLNSGKASISKTETTDKDIIFTIGKGTLTLKDVFNSNTSNVSIVFIEPDGNLKTLSYTKTTPLNRDFELFYDNNFMSEDSVIDDVTEIPDDKYSVGDVKTETNTNLVPEQNDISFGDKDKK